MTTPVSDQTDSDIKPRKSLSELADLHYGSNFVGEAKPDPVVEAEGDKGGGADAEDADLGTNEEGEEGEDAKAQEAEADDDADADADGEGQGEEAEGEASETEDGKTVETLAELVETLEADPDWAQGLKVRVKVHDDVSEVPIKDLVANYQMGKAGEKVLEKAKTHAENQRQKLAVQAEAIEVAFHAAAKLIEKAEQAILGEVTEADLAELRASDPAEWSARVAELKQKQEAVTKLKQDLVSEYQQNKEKVDANKASSRPDLESEFSSLMEEMPKVDPRWADPEQLPVLQGELAKYLVSQGFSEKEALGASDHRQLLIAQKAALWDASQKKVETAKKRVAKIPKMARPGAAKPTGHNQSVALKRTKANLRSSGSLDDAMAVLRAKRR